MKSSCRTALCLCAVLLVHLFITTTFPYLFLSKAFDKNKDRYTLFSPRLQEELRAYWRLYRPTDWLFPSSIFPDRPITQTAVQRAFTQTVQRAGLPERGGIHSLRQNAVSREMPSCTGNSARLLVNWRFRRPSTRHFRGPGERPSACRQGGNGPAAV